MSGCSHIGKHSALSVEAANLDILESTPENSRRPTNGGVDEETSGSRGREAPSGVRMVGMER